MRCIFNFLWERLTLTEKQNQKTTSSPQTLKTERGCTLREGLCWAFRSMWESGVLLSKISHQNCLFHKTLCIGKWFKEMRHFSLPGSHFCKVVIQVTQTCFHSLELKALQETLLIGGMRSSWNRCSCALLCTQRHQHLPRQRRAQPRVMS